MTVRVAFFGTPQPAVPALEALVADSHVEVATVVTNPDRPRGRGHRLQPSPVKVAAGAAGLPVWQPATPGEALDDLRGLDLDAAAVVAYGSLLPAEVLAATASGFVNLHFSLLPAWRGAAPVTHALLAGEARTGVTCFLIEEGMDTGPILLRSPTDIAPGETAGELTDRLAHLGAPLLVQAVTGLVDGRIVPTPQDHEQATYAPKVTPDDARLDWSRPATALEDAVRAFNPVPGAHTTFAGQRLKVHQAHVVDRAAAVVPGTVLEGDGDGGEPLVACGAGALRLVEVQPAGRARMDGLAFANGYRPAGVVLGS